MEQSPTACGEHALRFSSASQERGAGMAQAEGGQIGTVQRGGRGRSRESIWTFMSTVLLLLMLRCFGRRGTHLRRVRVVVRGVDVVSVTSRGDCHNTGVGETAQGHV